MEYSAVHHPDIHRYTVALDQKHEAYLVYSQQGDVIYLDHTEVPASLRGQGYGAVLMDTVLGEIAQQKLKVVPVCRYTRHYLQRQKKWQHLLDESYSRD